MLRSNLWWFYTAQSWFGIYEKGVTVLSMLDGQFSKGV